MFSLVRNSCCKYNKSHKLNKLNKLSSYLFSSSLPNIAVVLSGNGVFDGTEITEAVSVLISLSRRSNYLIYAPNINQYHVLNHINGTEMNETRNVLIESARIARGNIKDLIECKSSLHDGIIFPGGFGAAKNLSTFAFDGTDCKVNKDVENVIKDFHKNGKAMGFCCISPVVVTKVLGNNIEVTMGLNNNNDNKWPYYEACLAIENMNGKHINKPNRLAHIDKNNKVVTSAAYMYDGTPRDTFESVESMVDELFKLL